MKSWNEIRKSATAFSKRWKMAFDEKSQAQSFLKEFFEVFGVDTVTQATFEHRVKFSDGSQGFVDCFWPSTILMRLASKAAATRKFAATPGLFCQITQPEGRDYIIVPCVSSERREYVPIGFMTAETKVTNLVQIIPDATLYHFGVLTSRMHNAWMRAVCGRLELRYRYSKDIVYNNFIWPDCDGEGTVATQIETAAHAILDVRKKYLEADPACTLAILYNPETMPPDLLKAHQHLDALVDKAYGRKFANDAERVAHLFDLYAAAVK